MALKLEIISRETIKPSSPTPHHLRSFKFSLLDQRVPPLYVPIILFYPANDDCKVGNEQERSERLKKSLSETLTRFYPIAGRIKDNLWVDCNDKGVHYCDVRVQADLSQLLTHPGPETHVLNQLILPFPCGEREDGDDVDVLLAIQLNVFDCGGIAIGVRISHKISDAATLSTFLKAWTNTARGTGETVSPSFDAASLFPPKELDEQASIFEGHTERTNSDQKVVITRRFVFDGSKIAALRAKAEENSFVEHPTRVEVVLALLWACFMKLGGPYVRTSSMIILAVNLRRRMVPPLPEHSFGNLVTGTFAASTMESEIGTFHGLLGQLRDAVKKMNGDYVRKLQTGCDGDSDQVPSKGEVEYYAVTSWCKFSFYEADFGWGKPIWVTSVNLLYKNVIILMDTRCGDGVEASVSLEDEDMAKFEREHDLLTFATPLP